MSHRIEKINSLIHHSLNEVLLEEFGRQSSLFTIVRVDTSRDLGYTDVWISIFGNEKEVLDTLKERMFHIQRNLNKKLVLKKLPQIRFKVDRSGETSIKMEELLSSF